MTLCPFLPQWRPWLDNRSTVVVIRYQTLPVTHQTQVFKSYLFQAKPHMNTLTLTWFRILICLYWRSILFIPTLNFLPVYKSFLCLVTNQRLIWWLIVLPFSQTEGGGVTEHLFSTLYQKVQSPKPDFNHLYILIFLPWLIFLIGKCHLICRKQVNLMPLEMFSHVNLFIY